MVSFKITPANIKIAFMFYFWSEQKCAFYGFKFSSLHWMFISELEVFGLGVNQVKADLCVV